ncbi:MAG: SDR family oxidoreductase [Pseudomonadota bacterium]
MIKSILVTGGGSGIGAGLAVNLAERGCQVMISGRRQSSLDAVANQSPNIITCQADVTSKEDLNKLARSFAQLPGPRALFHGAGYFQLGKLDMLSAEDWQHSFETNVTSRWQLSTLCAPQLEGGRILFVGSDSGRNVRVGGAAYSVAQSASETLRRALQAEWADRNIAISAFKPGLVDTEMVQGFLSRSEEEFPARSAFQNYMDRGEFVTPEKVGKFVSWLLLDVDTERFASTEWDIRDKDHHAEWQDS